MVEKSWKLKVYPFYRLTGIVCVIIFFLSLFLLISHQFDKSYSILLPLFLIDFGILLIYGVLHQKVFKEIDITKAEKISRKYADKIAGFFPESEDFRNKLKSLDLEIKGSSIANNPIPLYGEGNYNGVNVRVGKVTSYQRRITKSYTILAVETNEKNLSFSLSETDSSRNENNVNQINEIENFLQHYTLESTNELELKKLIEKNFSLIKQIFQHSEVLYLNQSLSMADDNLFSGLGFLGTILKNDNDIEQALNLLVTLSKQI